MKTAKLFLCASVMYLVLPLNSMIMMLLENNAWTLMVQREYFVTLWNSFSLSVLSSLLSLVFSGCAIWRGRRLLRNVQTISLVFAAAPPFLLSLALSCFFIHVGLDNSLFALTVAHTLTQLPYMLFFLVLGVRCIPQEMRLQARLYARKTRQRVWYFYLPYMKPAVIAGLFICCTISLSHYVLTLMLSTLPTLTVRMVPLLQSGEMQAAAVYGAVFVLHVPVMFFLVHKIVKVA